MNSTVKIRLGLMMFLEYAVWGAWMPILSATLNNRGFSGAAVGAVYSAFWLGYVISPFIGGQLVDRYMPSQVFLGITHLVAAGAAFVMAHQAPGSMGGNGMFVWMLIWATIFAPGVGVTNSISLYHIDRTSPNEASRERAFSWIRTAGTAGWVVVAFIVMAVLTHSGSNAKGTNGPIRELMVTSVFGLIAAIYCFTLPNTPPNKDSRVDPLAFRKALFLFKSVPGFAIFMAISFFAATEFMFFYNLSSPFLETLHIQHIWIPVNKSISQVAEVMALGVLLPLWLPSKGMRWCLLVGSFAWPLRYVIFAIGKPVWLVVLSLGLHGFGYAFVIVVQQLYVDRVSPRDIRASAQSMLNMITLGVGNTLGSLLCGHVQDYFTHDHVINWVPIFVLPAVTTLICALAYMATFKEPNTETAGVGEPAPARACDHVTW